MNSKECFIFYTNSIDLIRMRIGQKLHCFFDSEFIVILFNGNPKSLFVYTVNVVWVIFEFS
jgi:hypothetical protein